MREPVANEWGRKDRKAEEADRGLNAQRDRYEINLGLEEIDQDEEEGQS